jgi:hypothetical protein
VTVDVEPRARDQEVRRELAVVLGRPRGLEAQLIAEREPQGELLVA